MSLIRKLVGVVAMLGLSTVDADKAHAGPPLPTKVCRPYADEVELYGRMLAFTQLVSLFRAASLDGIIQRSRDGEYFGTTTIGAYYPPGTKELPIAVAPANRIIELTFAAEALAADGKQHAWALEQYQFGYALYAVEQNICSYPPLPGW